MLELEDEIHTRVQSEVDKSQREFYLREQMKEIQTELGEGDILTRDMIELQEKIETANLPEEATHDSPQGNRTAEPDAAHGSRSGHHPHLSGLDPGPALEQMPPRTTWM